MPGGESNGKLFQMFTSNNLSIIDETGRSRVMAAAIPATNKWILTKQASVALSGLRDDRHGLKPRLLLLRSPDMAQRVKVMP